MKLGGYVALLALCSATIAHAQAITAQNPQSVAKALQDAGYKAELGKDNDGDPLISSASSGKKFIILFFGCKDNLNCTSIMFYTGFRGSAADLALVNQWNEERRFGRAAIDKENDPVVRFDVNIDFDGMSPKLFNDHIEIWIEVMDKFSAHVSKNQP